MIFSGINSREIARKNEVSFRTNVRPSNVTGKGEIGFSGVGGIPVRFHFESGFVYDRPDPSQIGDFVSSYDDLSSLEISGNISGSGSNSLYNYEVDGELVSLTGLAAGTGISKFFINTTGLNLDVSMVIASEVVSGELSFPDSFREQQNLTGHLVNNDLEAEITIYSGIVRSPTGMKNQVDFSLTSHDASISPGQSGAIVINTSGGLINRRYDVDLLLYTNYGQVEKIFTVSGQTSGELYSNLYLYTRDNYDFYDPDTSGVATGFDTQVEKTGFYTSYYQTYLNQDLYTGANFYTSLVYESGYTGDLFTGENGSGIISYGEGNDLLSGSGYIEGSGNLSSGTEALRYLSGVDILNGSLTSGLSITGYNNSTGSFLFYATGEGSLYYDMTGTGYATLSGDGGLSGTRVITTGSIVGTLTGTGIGGIHPYTGSFGIESGHRLFSGEVTGLPTNAKSLDYVNSGLQEVSGHSGILVDYIVASGVMTGDAGAMVSGLGDYSGYLTGYEKSFTGTWDLKTGYLKDNDLTGHVSYSSGEHYSGISGYGKEINKSPNGDTSYLIQVTQNTFFDREPMVVCLAVSGLDSYYSELITGQR